MAHAYTPGLTVTRTATLRRERRLPIPGQVMAKSGTAVTADQVVARTELPGNVQTVNVANLLGVPPEDIARSMSKREGDPVAKGEVIALNKAFFGLFTSKVAAPVAGKIETISHVTGNVILREPPIPLDVIAYVSGNVVEVLPNQGVVVETQGAFVQGIFGIGGETHGKLVMAVDRAEADLDRAALTRLGASAKGAILVGGATIHKDVLEAAVTAGVRGVVVGGFSDGDLREFLGYDLGVAITGHEEKGITLMVTEGFGRMPMAKKTFDLLASLQGQEASMNGATQIRAGVLRPELIVPNAGRTTDAAVAVHTGGLQIGTPVRVIREPYFGRLGKVTELPPELRPLETEAKVRVLEVELAEIAGEGGRGKGDRVVLPRANVEMIEG
jgi:hypothetical protein